MRIDSYTRFVFKNDALYVSNFDYVFKFTIGSNDPITINPGFSVFVRDFAVLDIDNDERDEVICATDESKFYVYKDPKLNYTIKHGFGEKFRFAYDSYAVDFSCLNPKKLKHEMKLELEKK